MMKHEGGPVYAGIDTHADTHHVAVIAASRAVSASAADLPLMTSPMRESWSGGHLLFKDPTAPGGGKGVAL